MSCIYCNGDVHPKRIEILHKKGALITCIDCAEQKVKRVTGFQVNEGKSERSIQVCTTEQAQRLMKFQRKTNKATGGPGFGPNAGKVLYKK